MKFNLFSERTKVRFAALAESNGKTPGQELFDIVANLLAIAIVLYFVKGTVTP